MHAFKSCYRKDGKTGDMATPESFIIPLQTGKTDHWPEVQGIKLTVAKFSFFSSRVLNYGINLYEVSFSLPKFSIMKTLILVRHAKSSWETPGQSDKERPLNERGKKDAPEMAKRLKEKNIKVDLFVSSPAKRALKTAKIFAEEFDVKKGDILEVEELYMATESAFLDTISHFDNSVAVAAVFSHNPGITEFASSLTHVKLDNMPTCSIFAVQAETDSWKDFSTAQKKFLFFDYPKKALHES